MKIKNAKNLRKKKFKTYVMAALGMKWKTLFGKEIPLGYRFFFAGKAKSGKSTMAMEFAEEFAEHVGKALYVSSEEGHDFTIKNRLEELAATKVDVAEMEGTETDFYEELMQKDKGRPARKVKTKEKDEDGKPIYKTHPAKPPVTFISKYKLIVLDSVQTLELTLSQYRALIAENPTAIWIIISQINNKGKTGKSSWEHDVDMLVKFQQGEAIAQGRTGKPTKVRLFDIQGSTMSLGL